jgi:single-strand DNA-binding protein
MLQLIAIGHLGKNPELKYTSDGVAVCEFSLACRGYKGETSWIYVTAWRGLAETVAAHLTKGQKVAVVGEPQIQEYEKDGQKRTSVKVQATSIEFLTPKGESNE